MTSLLEQAIRDLHSVDTNQTPFEVANQREKALVAGLHALAAHFGKEIEYTMIDARGEFKFNIRGAAQGLGGQYGEGLAEALSKVPRRMGILTTTASMLPENNWCWINHFDAEKMLKTIGEEMFGIAGPEGDLSPSPKM